jgi:hypothetical protein
MFPRASSDCMHNPAALRLLYQLREPRKTFRLAVSTTF